MPPKKHASSRFKSSNSNSDSTTSPSKPTTSSNGPVILYWHRTDLRLHDSPALTHALSLKPSAFYPIWTWDPHYVFTALGGANRWQFLVECMKGLSEGYQRISSSSSSNAKGEKQKQQQQQQQLWVVRESPLTVLPKLWKLWGVTHLVFEEDGDWYARERDDEVRKLADEAGVEVVSVPGRTLWDEKGVVQRTKGKPTMSMGQLIKATEGVEVARPFDEPTHIPGPGDGVDVLATLRGLDQQDQPKEKVDRNAQVRTASSKSKEYISLLGPNDDCGIPTLTEMGISPSDATTPHHGGESLALSQLASILEDEEYTATFEKPKTAPTDFNPRATTVLSAHLHFGSLGIRQFYWGVMDVYEKRRSAKKPVAQQPMNLVGQLMFRDMYFSAQYALGKVFQGEQGNGVCRVVDWFLPSLPSSGGDADGTPAADKNYQVDSPEAEEWFLRWKSGTTGFPFIDALMRQLKTEGWIHHLGRHMVACFLTRGGCYVHWERGKEVFEEWLIDHESASNAGNWMWLSCTAFFSQFFRCYSPVSFGKKWDPQGDFVRHYVPELAQYDKKYIYEPHKAPIADQKKWGCLIVKNDKDGDGKDGKKMKTYPKPMFDFNERRKICLDGMKHAYDVGMYGDDERRLNGEWKKVFGKKDVDVEQEQGGGEDEEEASSSKNRKRGRSDEDGEEQDESDDGENADHGDVTEEEDEKRSKRAKKGTRSTTGKGQKTLDGMVSRKKK